MTLRQQLNDPQGAVATYDKLLQRFGDFVPGVQEQCATALLNKGVTLSEKLNDPQGAVAAYDDLLQRFGDSPSPACRSSAPRRCSTRA
ncbi:MAG: tetratricopeptide repeat protein [Thiolinea sp.]